MGQTASLKQRLGTVFAGALALGLAQAAHATTTTYTYDSLGRVVTVVSTNGVTTTYTYDPAGNRSGQVILALPIVQPSSFSVLENSVNNALAPTMIGPPATAVAAATNPAHGTGTPSGVQFLYTPNTCYFGSDSFQYTASNGGPSSAPALISITVSQITSTVSDISQVVATNSVNNPINVTNVDLSSHISCAQSVTGIAITQSPGHGLVTTSVTGGIPQILYTPATGFAGTDTLKYAATNGAGSSPASATVTLTVNSSRSIWGQFPWGSGTW